MVQYWETIQVTSFYLNLNKMTLKWRNKKYDCIKVMSFKNYFKVSCPISIDSIREIIKSIHAKKDSPWLKTVTYRK